MRELDTVQHKQLKGALVQAFPSRGALDQLAYYSVRKRLNEITPDGSIDDMVFSLICWTEAQGCRDDLINGAFKENERNDALIRFRREVWEPFVPTDKTDLLQVALPVEILSDKPTLSSDCCLDVNISISSPVSDEHSLDPIDSEDNPAKKLSECLFVYMRDVREAIENALDLLTQQGEIHQDKFRIVCKRIEQKSQVLHTVLSKLVITQLVNIKLHTSFKVDNDYLRQKIEDVVLPVIKNTDTQGPLIYTVHQDMRSNLAALVQHLEHMDHQIYDFCSQVDPTFNIDQFDFYVVKGSDSMH